MIKAFRVKSPGDVAAARAFRVDYHLFDTFARDAHGGTGKTFDWDLLRTRKGGVPAIVAGGLTPDNVAEAIDGLESLGGRRRQRRRGRRPGVKDHNRIVSFMAAAQRAGAIQAESATTTAR